MVFSLQSKLILWEGCLSVETSHKFSFRKIEEHWDVAFDKNGGSSQRSKLVGCVGWKMVKVYRGNW